MLPEVLFSVPVAMFFPKNHFLVGEIDSKINDLHSAGLVDKWTSDYLLSTQQRLYASGPRKINVQQLTGILIIFVGGCTVSILCFVVESLMKRFKSRER